MDEEFEKKIASHKGEYTIDPECPKCGHQFVCCSDCGKEWCECK